MKSFTALAACISLITAASSWASEPEFTVRRFAENPIIRPDMLPDDPVININGPSLIRAPEWLPHPLGKYYLYFANHRGPNIHLAYADHLEGPWTIERPGPLSLPQVAEVDHETIDSKGHAASPDIYVDNEHRQIRMYFHFRLPKLGHVSTVAISADGLHFEVQAGTIGEPYLRHFTYHGWFYFVDREGHIARSRDGLTDFEVGPDSIQAATTDPKTGAALRHTGLELRGDTLEIFLTRVGDAPESILHTSMSLKGDWKSWRPVPPTLVLAPTLPYEGADLPVTPSEMGDAKGRQHQVRDPDIFVEDGRTYMVYSVAGEFGLAIAELIPRKK